MPGLSRWPEYEAARRQDTKLLFVRLHMLAEFHDAIAPDGEIIWDRLAIRLAQDYVPGLRPKLGNGPGSPRKDGERLALYLAVLTLLHTTRIKSVANACKILAARDCRWGPSGKALEARFHEAKRLILRSITPDELELDHKTGYPLNFPNGADLPIIAAFDQFRVRYGNLPSQFS